MPAQSPLRDGNGPGFALIETLRWEPHKGFLRLEQHLRRLAGSAAELGFRFAGAEAARALEAAVDGDAPLRTRLTLQRDGTLAATVSPYLALPPHAEWRLAIAATRLDSGDPLLRHKTTHRHAYEAARAAFTPAEADEVLLLNEQGELCEGTITNVFLDMGDGPLRTPALECGLLPGILRGELLGNGQAVEARLTPAALRAARTIWVGNSLRGLIRARFP